MATTSVLIVGAGAAGCAAAFALNGDARFKTTVWDPQPCAGGVATTVHFPSLGDLPINDGVQVENGNGYH